MTKMFELELSTTMTRPHHLLQVGLLLLVMTACSAADSTPISEDSPTGRDALSSGRATLSWDASVGQDVAGYKIYQAPTSGAYGVPIASTPMDVTNYTATGLESGTTYFFTVTAYNSDGAESSFSNQVSKTIL
jgi:hypothetical protein